jgi:tetratricopeptide (TPR) repeat protein
MENAVAGTSANNRSCADSIVRGWGPLWRSLETRLSATLRCALIVVAVLPGWLAATAIAQDALTHHSDGITIQGIVIDTAGKRVSDALVRLEHAGIPGAAETKTDGAGAFAFSAPQTGSYTLSAEKSGLRSRATAISVSSATVQKQINLVLEDSLHPSPSSQAMEFSDKPNFTVAGVTDWTAVGGHGSDSSLRTSEALTRETITLKPEAPLDNLKPSARVAIESDKSEPTLLAALSAAPKSFEANYRLGEYYLHAARYKEAIPLLQNAYHMDAANQGNEYDLAQALREAGDFSQAHEHIQRLLGMHESADYHRVAGELDEKLADPLAAVHELEQAVRLDPSEQNYFEWGSELLLHRAIWQAQEVFKKGTEAYPKSARMLTALGTALFAGARYQEAASSLCQASDLNPANPEPYMFMGKIEMAAPDSLGCIEQKLARFVHQQPENSLANYFYAMAIWKRQKQPVDLSALHEVETILTKAVIIDPKCSDGYLQLGILSSSQRQYQQAISFYTRAIEANPQLGEAHYRLGVAYDRIGQSAKAQQEFALHDEIEKQQAAAIEEQRREVKQFQIAPQEQATPPPAR